MMISMTRSPRTDGRSAVPDIQSGLRNEVERARRSTSRARCSMSLTTRRSTCERETAIVLTVGEKTSSYARDMTIRLHAGGTSTFFGNMGLKSKTSIGFPSGKMVGAPSVEKLLKRSRQSRDQEKFPLDNDCLLSTTAMKRTESVGFYVGIATWALGISWISLIFLRQQRDISEPLERKPDFKDEVTRMEDSHAIEYAKSLKPDYDLDEKREQIKGRWDG